MEKGVSTFLDTEEAVFILSKNEPLKKIFTKKESVYSGSRLEGG